MLKVLRFVHILLLTKHSLYYFCFFICFIMFGDFLVPFNKHLGKYITLMVERDLPKSILLLSHKAKAPR